MHRLKIALSQPRGRVCSPSIFMRALLFFLGLAQSMTFRIFCEGGKETVFDNSLVFFFHDHKHLDTQESGSISF